MTIVPVHHLQTSDLRTLGHDLPAHVRRDHAQVHAAVNRSLAVHGEQLTEEDAAAIEAACTSEAVAS